jgi:hypothetical protein
MQKQHSIEKPTIGLQSSVGRVKRIKKFPANPSIIKSVTALFEGNVDRIKYLKGFNNASISSDGGTSVVYMLMLYDLLEMMIRDVIAGDLVYFGKDKKAFFYVGFITASEDLIMGKGIERCVDIPLVDFRITGYKMPYIFLDTGHPSTKPAICKIPRHLYIELINAVNKGKKYISSPKKIRKNADTNI